jgi:hypothetical protein
MAQNKGIFYTFQRILGIEGLDLAFGQVATYGLEMQT